MKNTKNKKSKTYKSDNTWLYEEPGIYNSDQEKDKKINDELKLFHKSISCKPTRIKIYKRTKNTKGFVLINKIIDAQLDESFDYHSLLFFNAQENRFFIDSLENWSTY